ncbi:MAG TPA: spore protease YyaC, partial [Clostridia bacterium]|nr:spore protease YyaC [Clostridia bacterium]
DINKPYSFSYFCNYFEECMSSFYDGSYSDIIIVCIGTDRATGDCLGPLIGYKVKDMKYDNVHVFGTLDEPVHAKNLNEYIRLLDKYEKPFVIAIDACLGRLERIGFVNIKEGPLSPGSGVNKNLPSIGHVNITGIVNVGGFMEIMILQNTRLSIVMNMANLIANGLKYNMWKINRKLPVSEVKPVNHQLASVLDDNLYVNNDYATSFNED